TILIVEDVKISFEFLKIVLEKSGINIIWAKNGEEAIKLCKRNTNINLVLMDINMPVMNGYEATKEIKKFRPGLPVIAQTAYAIAGDREKSLEAGCDDYITKPIKKDKLLAIIEKHLTNKVVVLS
ncbi:MAG: response regulator, partial [Chlorobi bacterium]|nr:response regulator [Chlorobiota bacterium]